MALINYSIFPNFYGAVMYGYKNLRGGERRRMFYTAFTKKVPKNENEAPHKWDNFASVIHKNKKIKAVIRAKGNVGKHIATLLPLGYKKGPNDKEKW